MTSRENSNRGPSSSCRRRRFLQRVGAVGITGTLAGCVGGDDDGGGDEGTGDGEPATFEVSGLDPEAATVTRTETLEVDATVENVGDEEGIGNVELRVDGDAVDSEELSLGGGDEQDVSLALDAADLEGGEYEYAVTTDDDGAGGTVVVEAAVDAMTYNIRYDNTGDEDPWEVRRDRVTGLLEDVEPDVIGVQEALPHQFEHLREDLPDYEWYAVPRDEDGEGEAVPVGWRTDRYEAVETDTFWLSEAPDEPGSVGWDAALPRVVSWAELEDKSTGNRFWLANAHFDHVGEEARLESAKMVRERAQERLDDGQRCIVLGDFNATPEDEPYEELVATDLVDSRGIAAAVEGPEGTHLGDHFLASPEEDAEPDSDSRIDYVFVPDGAPVERYWAIPEAREEGYRSDHLPVFVRVDSYALER